MGEMARRPTQTPGSTEIAPYGSTWGPEMRLPRVLRPFSRLVSALQGVRNALRDVTAALRALCEIQKAVGPGAERLDALERSHHQFEALCEGLLLKAEGKLRSANNAEARTRADRKAYEHLIDPLTEDGGDGIPPQGSSDTVHDVEASEAERLHSLRLDVASNPKALAQRAKFGVR